MVKQAAAKYLIDDTQNVREKTAFKLRNIRLLMHRQSWDLHKK
jgi:hypothetical protein